jgi:ATP-dependent Lon protease
MKESATIALEYIKANAKLLGLFKILSKYNIHLHVPEGATPKTVQVLELPC